MGLDISAAISASQHVKAKVTNQGGAVLVAGGGGKLGSEVVRRLVALVSLGRYRHVTLMVTENFHAAMAGVHVLPVSSKMENGSPWQPEDPQKDFTKIAQDTQETQNTQNNIETAVVMFEPPRMFYARERTIWTPHPSELPALATWLYARGVRHLLVVLPHQPGMLPDALQQGLANLDEQVVTTLGFERVIFMRMAQADTPIKSKNFFERVAYWMLGVGKYMLPANQSPLRVTQIAKLVEQVLQSAPSGHVVIPPSGMLPTTWNAP